MKNVLHIVAMLAILCFVNGCGDNTKDVAEQSAAVTETETPATEITESEAVVEEAETTATEAVAETEAADPAVVEEPKPAEAAPVAAEVKPADAAPASEPAAEEAKPTDTADEAVDSDAVVVTVNGQKITEKEVSDAVDTMIEMQKKRMPPGMQLPDTMAQQIRKSVVDKKVDMILLNQKMKEKDLPVSDEQITQELQNIADQQGVTMEQIEADITQSGMTMEDVKDQLRYTLQIKTLMESEDPSSVVAEADVKKFYDENPNYFEKPEQVRASHILIKFEPNATDEQKAAAKEKIEGLLKRARAGEDFAALAKEYTEDPGSKESGGEYTFPRGQMVKAFEDTAFGLEVGQISDAVETQYGYHIIKLSEKIPASKTPFEEVKAKITQFLTQQKQSQFWPPYRESIMKDAAIEYSAAEQALRDEMEKAAAARAAARQAQMAAPAPQPVQKADDAQAPAEEK